MNFEFATATRILFGPGKRSELPGALKSLGTKGLLVTGTRPDRALWVTCDSAGIDFELFSIPGEPTVQMVWKGAELARAFGAQFVVAVGGGSAIDAGKAIAALATNRRPVLDYLEVIGAAQPLTENPLPFIAVPTTAGTGAEVTRNAVLGAPQNKVKVSLRSPKMLPALAIVDPELTYDLPPQITASTGMDALTQVIEPFLSIRANPLTDAICREAIPRAFCALRRAIRGDREARAEMSFASLCGGLALANAGLGAVHGFAAPIGGMFPAPHGAVCAALLPHSLSINLQAIRQRAENPTVLERFHELAGMLTGHGTAEPEEAISQIAALTKDLQIPPLRTYGIKCSDFPDIVLRAANASSMKANPIALTEAELIEILARAT